MSSSSKWPVPSLFALAPPFHSHWNCSRWWKYVVDLLPWVSACAPVSCCSMMVHGWQPTSGILLQSLTPWCNRSAVGVLPALRNDREAQEQHQADTLMWLRTRVHVCPAHRQRLLQESKMALGEYSLRTDQVAPCCLLWIWYNVSTFKFASTAVESHKINTFSFVRWFVLFNSFGFHSVCF